MSDQNKKRDIKLQSLKTYIPFFPLTFGYRFNNDPTRKIQSDRNTFNGAREIQLMSDGNKRWNKKVHCSVQDHLTSDPTSAPRAFLLPLDSAHPYPCKKEGFEKVILWPMAERLLF